MCLAGQPIAIVFSYTTPPEPAAVTVMNEEIRKILEPAQLDLTFQQLGDSTSQQSFRKIVLIRFQGTCRSRWFADPIRFDQPALLDDQALGRTDVSDGRVLPYVNIFCNEIRAIVPKLSQLSPHQLYGRALGRVVVHELYHALLATQDHARNGIARHLQSARALTQDKLALDPASIQRLRMRWGNDKGLRPLSPIGESGALVSSVHQP